MKNKKNVKQITTNKKEPSGDHPPWLSYNYYTIAISNTYSHNTFFLIKKEGSFLKKSPLIFFGDRCRVIWPVWLEALY